MVIHSNIQGVVKRGSAKRLLALHALGYALIYIFNTCCNNRVAPLICILTSSYPLFGQPATNLVLNPGFETWENHRPAYWRVVTNSPDLIKCGVVFYPKLDPNALDSDLTITRAMDGASFVHLANSEIIEGKLSSRLIRGQQYIIECAVNQLALKGTKVPIDKLTVGLSSVPVPHNLSTGVVSKFLEVPIPDLSLLHSNEWQVIKAEFTAEGEEEFIQIGAFLKGYEYLGLDKHLVNFSIDRIALYPKRQWVLHFPSDQFQLPQARKQDLDRFLGKIGPNEQVMITGFSSTTGSSKQNLELSRRRAIHVRDYIWENYKQVPITIEFRGDRLSRENDTSFQKVIIDIMPKSDVNAACGMAPDLVALLTEVDNRDQKHRLVYDSLMRKEKVDSTFLAILDRQIMHDDSINRSIIDSVISMKGYVGLSMVGKELMDVVFNVILHAPLEYRLKYTEVIRKAADECEFNFSFYPYLIDRNLLDQGKDQKFGTQFRYDEATRKFVLFRIEDMQVVDSLRKTYFMPKLSTYIEYMNQ